MLGFYSLFQILLTNALTYWGTAYLCFPMKSRLLSSLYAKHCRIPFELLFVQTISVNIQISRVYFPFIRKLPFSTFICKWLLIYHRINRPLVFLPSSWKYSETEGRTSAIYFLLPWQVLIYQYGRSMHLFHVLSILASLFRQYMYTYLQIQVSSTLRYFLFRTFSCSNKEILCKCFFCWRLRVVRPPHG